MYTPTYTVTVLAEPKLLMNSGTETLNVVTEGSPKERSCPENICVADVPIDP